MIRWLRQMMNGWFRSGSPLTAVAAGRGGGDVLWSTAPVGCCRCGTGGPYYFGAHPPLVRYLYTGVMAGNPTRGELDWSACSSHPLANERPVVDLGDDMVITFVQAKVLFDAAWAESNG